MIKCYWLILIIFVSSCSVEKTTQNEQTGNDTEKPEKKFPSNYALEYCNCLSSGEMKPENCDTILISFQKQYGSQNKEAEIEFSKEMQNCL